MNVIGELNPQLLRELKGRVKTLPIILTLVISIFIQTIIFFGQLQSYPDKYYSSQGEYCYLKSSYVAKMTAIDAENNKINKQLQLDFNYYSKKENYDLKKIKQLQKQISDNNNKYQQKRDELSPHCPPKEINSQLWWQDNAGKIFKIISEGFIWSLLVGGVYFLIHDLSKENRQGSLNFIRLTPQPAKSILLGKALGVPILLYMGVAVAIPLQIFTGITSKVPLTSILGFDGVLIASSMVFYSAALLFALATPWLSGFQSWLGSGIVFSYLLWSKDIHFNGTPTHTPPNFISLFNPYSLIPGINVDYVWENFQWFGIKFGKTEASLAIFSICFYLIISIFIWHSLGRCFNNIEANILSKKQSYILTIGFTIISFGTVNLGLLGLINSGHLTYHNLFENLNNLTFGYLFLLIYLIIALTPRRQKLQDWIRYRRLESQKSWFDKKLLQDLIFNEKSPSTVAIFINSIIYLIGVSVFILMTQMTTTAKLYGLTSQVFAISLITLYASIFQLSLFSKSQHRILWGIGNLAQVIILPMIFINILLNFVSFNPEPKLLTILAPSVILENYHKIPHQSYLIVFLFYWVVISILNFIVFRGLQKAGET